MSVNLAGKFGTGLTPQAFMDGMNKNKEKFADWHARFTWENQDDLAFFQSLRNRDDLRCLIVAADWCGDVVRNVPVVFKVLAETGMPVEVLIMEQNTGVIDQFLTMGGRAIPKVIFTDTGGVVLGDWGPRPEHVQKAMIRFKTENPDNKAPDYQDKLRATYDEMRRLYGEGTAYQTVIVKELRKLLAKV
ncbi:MAG TPA: thioredoxin family protein [Bacilli bacterium]